jgi:peptidyl-prolyl cis-trans isomerase A (cyclophilin A)
MKLNRKTLLTVLVLILFSGSIIFSVVSLFMNQNQKSIYVIMETNVGEIELELYNDVASITVENFVAYVEDGFYDGLCFHRVIPEFMIQGGGFYPNGTFKTPNDPIQLESRNGQKNIRGSIAMARSSEPNSATSQFFINTVDNDALNYPNPDGYGYAVFGRVSKGMDVVDGISGALTDVKETPYGEMSNWPVADIVIERVYLKNN